MKQYHSLSIEEVLKEVDSAPVGLSEAEVEKRKETHGLNVLPEAERTTVVQLFFRQFKSFLILILLAAAGISFALGDATDAAIIFAAVLLNVIVGFIQEGKAERALDALKHVITLEAKVLRDGKENIIDVKDIVPGDIILLNAGDKIPADARLLSVSELETNEAALTGESASIIKHIDPVEESAGVGDRENMVFTGTVVTRGSGTAVVIATGVKTEIGHIAELLSKTPETITPIQKKLDRFAHGIGVIVLLICAIVFVIGLLKGMSFVEIFTVAVAIAVSAIPEGLVVGVTIILAIGMQRILTRNALVRNLQAAETLGSTSVICTDKTGTLTEGNMQVVSLITKDYHFDGLHEVERHAEEGLKELMFALNIGMLCNDAHIVQQDHLEEVTIVGNLTERALLSIGMQLGLDHAKLNTAEPRLATIPFDSSIKYMATLHQHPEGYRRMYIKGAPEQIIELAVYLRTGAEAKPFTRDIRKEFENKFIENSKKGLRLLGLGYKDVPAEQETLTPDDMKDIVFVGFVGIKDPLRPHIRETFDRTEGAGIKTVMITGDHKLTASAIAEELGFDLKEGSVVEGSELHAMTEKELRERVQEIVVYARVSPEDKLNIINAWQSHGYVVAMTGDGVNDSPALKAADMGVALGSGTDVAKEASDMVLLDDNYKTIVAAVEEGRGIFDNIRKVVLYLISDSFAEVILITSALIIGIPLPLLASQILWINLISDGLPSIAMTVEPKEKNIMDEPPRKLDEPVINGEIKILTICVSILAGFSGLGIFYYFYNTTGQVDLARTVVFTFFAVKALLYVFSTRCLRNSIFSYPLFSNPWLLGAVVVAFFVQLAAVYTPFLQTVLQTVPLGVFEWSVIVSASVIIVLCIELIKYILNRRTITA